MQDLQATFLLPDLLLIKGGFIDRFCGPTSRETMDDFLPPDLQSTQGL